MPERDSIVWSAYEHQHIERGREWYWALGVIAASTALISILFGNILFALLIIVAAVTMGLMARRPPDLAQFELHEKGLRVNDTEYTYKEMNAFWVSTDEPGEPILLIDTKRFLMPHLIIPLPGDASEEDLEIVRAIFRNFDVQEVELQEPVSHKILELIGF